MRAYLPRWSPDGRQIAFAGQLPGKPWRIYLISADGGMPVPLISGEGTEFDPNWSPDGLRIVFAPLPWETTPDRTEVSILDLKTRQVSSLAGSKGLYSPRWSPDGSSIVAVTSDTQELMLLDFKNQKWGKLPTGPTHYPMWSRSGKYVYYGRAGTGSPDLYGVRIADRKVEKLLNLKGVRIAYLPGMGPWVGLTPQDEPLILRDVGSEEIYSLDWEAP
jgi:Tol biopolymer transport system component